MSRAGCHYCGLPLRLSQYGESYYCTRACWHLANARATRLRGESVNAQTPDSADKTRQIVSEGTGRPEGVVGGVSSAVVSLRSLPRRIFQACVPAEQAVPVTSQPMDRAAHSFASDANDGGGGDAGRAAHSPQRPVSPVAQASTKTNSAEGNA